MVKAALVGLSCVMMAIASLPVPVEALKGVGKDLTELEYLGEYRCTAYCGCRKCNGKWYGYPTASGTDYEQGRTIAVDPDVIPLGAEVFIEGYGWFVAEDTGYGIDGLAIDMYYDSHSEALKHGIQYVEVWVKEGAI